MFKKLLLIGLLSLGFYSCDDALEITQDGELNDERLFKNVANMQLFLNETYDRVSIQNDILVSSLLTDEVGLGSAGFSNDTHRFFIFSTNGFAASIWNQHYQAINYANRLIRGAQLVTPAASEVATYNNIVAQARAIRAFSHFQLLTYFSQDLSNNNAPGVMKIDFVPTAQQKVPRASNGEVFGLIESDLLFAQNNLTNSTTGTDSWIFFNVNSIDALRARMYLYRKNYTLAEQYADNVIANGPALASCSFTNSAGIPQTSAALPPYTAAQVTQLTATEGVTASAANAPLYRRMWTDQAQGEIVFSLRRANNNANFGSQYNTNQSNLGGGPLFDMGRTLFNLYAQPLGGGAEDFRRWSFVDRTSTFQANPLTATKNNEVIVIDKYCGKSGNAGSNDLKIFRTSEMYFIKAECRARANDLAGAALLIQTVRQNRSYTGGVVPLPIYGNATAAYADILLERRKELSFEGHRYIDLKRLGTDAGVTSTDRYSQDSVNSSATNPANINVTDYRFTLPIPQNEINVNPISQNTGY